MTDNTETTPTSPVTEPPIEQPTCPLCHSPLIGDAIRNGKCQCCGHRFDPDAIKA